MTTRIDKVLVRPCPDRGNGYAVIAIHGQGLPGTACHAILHQGSGASRKVLGPQGWQPSEARLMPVEVRATAEGMDMVLGPDVLRHLSQGNYRLRLSDGTITTDDKAFSWTLPPYRPSRMAPPTEPVQAAPPTSRLQDDATMAAPPALAAAHEPEPKPEPEPEPQAPPPTDDLRPIPISTKPRTLPLIPIAAGLGVLVLAVAAWIMLGSTEQPETAARPSSPAIADTEAMVRRMVAENASPQSMSQLGRQLLDEGQVGAAMLLLRRAGDGGDSDALVTLGRLFDPSPAGRRIEGAPEPSGIMALNLYHRAGQAGTAGKAALAAWAKDRAAAGDPAGTVIVNALANLDR